MIDTDAPKQIISMFPRTSRIIINYFFLDRNVVIELRDKTPDEIKNSNPELAKLISYMDKKTNIISPCLSSFEYLFNNINEENSISQIKSETEIIKKHFPKSFNANVIPLAILINSFELDQNMRYDETKKLFLTYKDVIKNTLKKENSKKRLEILNKISSEFLILPLIFIIFIYTLYGNREIKKLFHEIDTKLENNISDLYFIVLFFSFYDGAILANKELSTSYLNTNYHLVTFDNAILAVCNKIKIWEYLSHNKVFYPEQKDLPNLNTASSKEYDELKKIINTYYKKIEKEKIKQYITKKIVDLLKTYQN